MRKDQVGIHVFDTKVTLTARLDHSFPPAPLGGDPRPLVLLVLVEVGPHALGVELLPGPLLLALSLSLLLALLAKGPLSLLLLLAYPVFKFILSCH